MLATKEIQCKTTLILYSNLGYNDIRNTAIKQKLRFLLVTLQLIFILLTDFHTFLSDKFTLTYHMINHMTQPNNAQI